MNRLSSLSADALTALEFLGIVLALLLVVGVLGGILRSIWRTTFGETTLVLPFSGGEVASAINIVLAGQLGRVEGQFLETNTTVAQLAATFSASDSVSLPLRVRPDQTLDEKASKYLAGEPISSVPVGSISLAGVSISPDTIFALSYRLRGLTARRTVRGNVTEFADTIRLSATFTHKGVRPLRGDDGSPRRQSDTIVLVRQIQHRQELLGTIDDLAFCIVKKRIGFDSEAHTWSAYKLFSEGYVYNLQFLRTGSIDWREKAVVAYRRAVELDPEYRLAHYNLGNLLYNRYDQGANAEAIDQFQIAELTTDPDLRALALAGRALAYCQNVHRFGLGTDPWVRLAAEASEAGLNMNENLPETRLARAFAYQVADDYSVAIREYEQAASLQGDALTVRQIRSFADNNRAWLYLTKFGQLDTARAILINAAKLYPNKMIYANLGDIERRQGNLPAAVDAYMNALRLDPSYTNAYNEAGMVYLAFAKAAETVGDCAKFLAEADRWHQRALSTVSSDAEQQRAEVIRAFSSARDNYGFS